jgi:hypothetical protein
MKLAIFGSRSITGQEANKIITDCISVMHPDSILTAAEPEGICALARSAAAAAAIPLKVFYADNVGGLGEVPLLET